MCGFRRGEILVLPREGGPATLDLPPERYYSAETILNVYAHTDDERRPTQDARGILRSFVAQPFVLRVREGTEIDTALEFQRRSQVASAIPNFTVRPMSAFTINDTAIRSLSVAGRFHGQGARITVVDSGVEPSSLTGAASLTQLQFDVRAPRAGSPPSDEFGHGSAVARIIEEVAPGAELQSIRVFPDGTLAGVIMAIQLAISTFQPHVVNLSLGIDFSHEHCINCGWPIGQQFPEEVLHRFFEALDYNPNVEPPTYVAAAGNDSRIVLPARCDTTIAVGAYDEGRGDRADYAEYPNVPANRFIMAHGGSTSDTFGYGWDGAPLFGTSFSAPIISAIAAQIATQHDCDLTRRECVLDKLARYSVTEYGTYDSALHGLGVVA